MSTADHHHAPNHDYHLLDPSPWPILGAFAGFVMAFGLILLMHPDFLGPDLKDSVEGLGVIKLFPGIGLIFATMYFWWRDVIAESHRGDHKPVVQLGLRYGMTLFIASEVMFFAAFFWAFFDARLYYDEAIQFLRVEAMAGCGHPLVLKPLMRGIYPYEYLGFVIVRLFSDMGPSRVTRRGPRWFG